ncbi:MAG: hypothetical protein ABI323_09645 [Solirubrobacteraceae bacterium]
MSEAWPAIKIKEFEHVVTGPSSSLLRINGQGPRRREPGPRPALVIDDGTKLRHFPALPAPADSGRTLRAAYSVPPGLVRNARAYWLDHEDGARTKLPAPEPGVARLLDGDSELPAPDVDIPDAYDEVRRLEQRILELEEVHARDRREAISRANEAGARVAAAEEQAAAAERRERLAADRRAAADAQTKALTQQMAEAARTSQSLQARLASVERELAQASASIEPLKREVLELRAARKSLERELDTARDRVRLLTSERDELSRQASAFDAVAVKARERASHAEAAHQKSSSTLQELEVWRAELERRLASTTSELGAVRAAREADGRELARLRGQPVGELHVGVSTSDLPEHDDRAQTLAAQAAEIERLAAELAWMRARNATGE